MTKLILFFSSAEEFEKASLTEALQPYVNIPWIMSVDKIAEHQPKFILALGTDSIEQLTGIAKLKIKSNRGKVLFSEKFSCKVIPTFDISGVFKCKTPETHLRMFLSDINFAVAQSEKQEYKHNYYVLAAGDIEGFDRFIAKISAEPKWSYDIESHEEESFDVAFTKILGIGFSWKVFTGVYVILQDRWTLLPEEEYKYKIGKLKELFANKAEKIAHNGKYDGGRLLQKLDIYVNNFTFDTMLAHHLNDENIRHSLDEISDSVVDLSSYKAESEAFLPKQGASFTNIPTAILAKRCCSDADLTLRLEQVLRPKLQEQKLWTLFSKIVMPHQECLAKGERRGVLIDMEELHRIEPIIVQKIGELEINISKLIGKPIGKKKDEFNPGSWQQVSALFEELHLDIPDEFKKADGTSKTDIECLEAIKHQHAFPMLLAKYRQLNKLLSTYIIGIRERVNANGIIHTSYLVHGTTTGRLSSRNPNLQNIPTDQLLSEEYGLENISIHRLFIARPGYKLLTSDASQIELRMLAVLSQDPIIMQAYRNNEDVHTITALAIIPGAAGIRDRAKSPNATDSEKDRWDLCRKNAKTVNFGIIYGRGPGNLAQQLGVSFREAKSFIDGFFEKYSGAYTWMQQSIGQCKRVGYVENLFGRRRRLLNINSPNQGLQAEAQRQCLNAPVQGSAADCTAIANIRISRLFEENNIDGGFILNVHDELVYEVREDHVEKAQELIRKGWLDPISKVNIPLDISMGVADRWSK